MTPPETLHKSSLRFLGRHFNARQIAIQVERGERGKMPVPASIDTRLTIIIPTRLQIAAHAVDVEVVIALAYIHAHTCRQVFENEDFVDQ